MLALVINIYTGPLTLFSQHKLHPLNKLESILKWFDLKLNRKNRSPIERRVRGCLTVISILFLSGLFGIVGVWFSQKFPLASILDIILLLIIIDQKNTYTTAQKIKVALRDHNIESVLQSIRGLTAESIEKMDSFAIARTTIEMLTTLLITRLIAPTFFYVLFGLLGLAIYCALDMMNIKIGSRTPHYKDFGIVARHLNAVVLFFPSLLTGILNLIFGEISFLIFILVFKFSNITICRLFNSFLFNDIQLFLSFFLFCH